MTTSTPQDYFMIEFDDWCKQNDEIHYVKFFGSVVERPEEWKMGKSDIDVFAFGNNISGETKRMTYKVFCKLNQKYDLRLEEVAAVHPLIIFIDSPPRQIFYALIKSGNFDSPQLRKFLKYIMPKWKEIIKLPLDVPNPLWKFA